MTIIVSVFHFYIGLLQHSNGNHQNCAQGPQTDDLELQYSSINQHYFKYSNTGFLFTFLSLLKGKHGVNLKQIKMLKVSLIFQCLVLDLLKTRLVKKVGAVNAPIGYESLGYKFNCIFKQISYDNNHIFYYKIVHCILKNSRLKQNRLLKSITGLQAIPDNKASGPLSAHWGQS